MHHYDVQNLKARIYSGFDWTRFIASFSVLGKFRKREFSFTAMDVQCVQEIVTILAHARAHHVHTGFWIRSVWFLINLLWLTLYFSLNGKVRVHICRVIPEIEIYLLYLASVVGLVFLSQEKLLLFFRFCFLELKAIELLISLFVLWLRIPLSYASFKQFAEKTKCIYPEMIDVEMKYGWSSTTSLNRTRHRVDFLREMATVYFR